ncbi:hypothetical protein [Citricoccus sp. K5]|uniref:hypothetical protein n=1 Tax=Citricoccus sp. K5 TaxID=2653135 RepID=UPI00135A625C|nr:hypothetical protein [Citricoccus sp. K5]
MTVSIGVDAGHVGTVHAGRQAAARKNAGSSSSKEALRYNWAENKDVGGDRAAIASPTEPFAYSNASGTGLYPSGSLPGGEGLDSLGLWLSHTRASDGVSAQLLPGAEFVSDFLLKAETPDRSEDIFPDIPEVGRWQGRIESTMLSNESTSGKLEFSEPKTDHSESGFTYFQGLVRFTTDQPVNLGSSVTRVEFLPRVTWKSEMYLSLRVSSVLRSGVIELRQGNTVERLDIAHDGITDVRLNR